MLENKSLDPRAKDPKEIAGTPSDKGTKKTEDGILSNLDFWQNRYSDGKTKYEQISLVDAINAPEETPPVVFDSDKEYIQTSFEGFEPVSIPKRKKRRNEPDEIDEIFGEIKGIISHYEDSAETKEDDAKAEIKDEPKEEELLERAQENSPVIEPAVEGEEKIEETEIEEEEEVLIEPVSPENKNPRETEEIIKDTEVSQAEMFKEGEEEVTEGKEKDEEEAQNKRSSLYFPDDDAEEEKSTSGEADSVDVQKSEDTEEITQEKDSQQPLTLLNNSQEGKEDDESEIPAKEEESDDSEKDEESAEPKKEEPKIISEYSDVSQRDIILKGLKASLNRSQFIKTAVLITFILSIAITSIPVILDLLKLDVSSFEPMGHIVLTVINIVLLILAVCFSSQSFISGFISLKHGITAHTVSSFTAIIALVQAIVSIFASGDLLINKYSYISVAVFAIFLNTSAEEKNIKRILTCFKFCAFTQSDALFSIRAIEGSEDAADIGKNLDMEDPKILYSGKIDFATDFLKNCKSSGVSSAVIKRNLAVSIVMSIIVAGITAATVQNIFAVLSTFSGTFCLTAPLGVLFSLASALLSANKALAKDGGTILSYPSAQKCAQADAVAVDCADLFCRAQCEIVKVKSSGAVRLDDVLLFAVSMILQSGGPLSEAFNRIIEGQREMLPRVNRLRYIDKLGLSAKIYGHEIFFGTRELMFKNGINLNLSPEERKYLQSGCKILYMCVDAVFAGYFVLKYQEDKTLFDSINEIENKGIKFIMRTDDPNVTNEYIIKCFKLSPDSVKSTVDIGSVALRWYRNSLVPTDTAGVLHDGNPYSYFMTIAICHRLRKFAQSFKTFALIFSLLFAAAATAAVITGTWILLSPFTIIAIHAIAIFITFIAQKIKI